MTRILNDEEYRAKLAEAILIEDYDERLDAVEAISRDHAVTLTQTFIQPELHMAAYQFIDTLVAVADWDEEGDPKPSTKTRKNGALAKAVDMTATRYNLNREVFTPKTRKLMEKYDFFRET